MGRSKHLAMRVACPKCGAPAWQTCIKPDQTVRRAYHLERHMLFRHEGRPPVKRVSDPSAIEAWGIMRAKVFALKGSQCAYCGDDAWHVDHRTPKARGGSDDMSNLEPCCARCNTSKGLFTVEEWRREP